MTIHGDLADFPLAEVAILFEATRRTGVLTVDASTSNPRVMMQFIDGLLASISEGSVEYSTRRTVAARLSTRPGLSGRFTFEPGMAPVGHTTDGLSAAELAAALHGEASWFATPVDMTAHVFRLAPELPPSQARLDIDRVGWSRLVALSQAPSLGEAARSCDVSMDVVLSWCRSFESAGLGVTEASESDSDSGTGNIDPTSSSSASTAAPISPAQPHYVILPDEPAPQPLPPSLPVTMERDPASAASLVPSGRHRALTPETRVDSGLLKRLLAAVRAT